MSKTTEFGKKTQGILGVNCSMVKQNQKNLIINLESSQFLTFFETEKLTKSHMFLRSLDFQKQFKCMQFKNRNV
jgi:hypothetical protein